MKVGDNLGLFFIKDVQNLYIDGNGLVTWEILDELSPSRIELTLFYSTFDISTFDYQQLSSNSNITKIILGLNQKEFQIPVLEVSDYYVKIFTKYVEDGLILDDVHLLDKVVTMDDIIEESVISQAEWDENTIMLCYFQNNLTAGNIENLNNPILQWEVYRKEQNDDTFTLMDTLPVKAELYIDSTTQPYKTYEYEIVAINEEERSEPIRSKQVYICSYNDVLIDSVTGESHIFNLNLKEGESMSNVDFVKYDGVNKYPSIVRGQRDYMSYAITAIPMYQNSEKITYSQTSEYLDSLKAFINNPNDKILKTRKGFIYRGQTNGYKQSPLLDGIDPYIVSFEFYETGVV